MIPDTCYWCGSKFILDCDSIVLCHMCGRILYERLYVPIFERPIVERKVKRRLIEKETICVVCGVMFKTYNNGGRTTKNTCSDECRKIKNRQNSALYREKRRNNELQRST